MLRKELFSNIIRLSLGGMFVIAAILKLLSIDEFEIYIYSFNIFNFLITTVLSRLLIAGEFLLGLFLMLKIHYKTTWKIVFALMAFFTLFLIYTAIFRNDENCHCFGDFVKLNPIESIVKNVLVMVLLLLERQRFQSQTEYSRIFICSLSVIAVLLPFIISPMDSIYNRIYSGDDSISTIDFYEAIDEVVEINFSDEIVFDTTAVLNLDDGKYLVAFVSAGCKYCKLGVQKLSMIMRNKGMDTDKVKILIWGSVEGIKRFREETLTEGYSYWHILPNMSIDITYGKFPAFVWIEDKNIVNIGNFRDIDDNLNLTE